MPFKTIIIVITALLFLPRVEDILSGRCNAYREFEAAASCGKKGYLMQFGLRNCMIFNTPGVRSRYTAEGHEFLDCVMKRLIDHLQDVFSKGIPSCPELDKSAFDSHVPCFLECGLCKICKTEKFALLSTFDKYDFFSYEVIKAGLRLLWTCENNLTDRCDDYKVLEDKASCGNKGYLIQFGLRNCLKFASPDIRSRFTPPGLVFLDCTTKCLITRLQNLFVRDTPTCSIIEKSAFASHLPCYLKCNFCKICKTEKGALLNSYDKSDLFSYEAMKTAIKLLRTCGLFACFRSS